MKSILLKCDEKFFFKVKEDKAKLEKETRGLITWEDYIKHLFGFKKLNLVKKK